MESGYLFSTLLNSILDSGVKSSPPISFVLYVPPASQSPLYILDEHGKKLPSNGFLIPRWGGIIIANPQSEHLSVHDLKPFMRVYLSQLRDLLGIKENWNRDFKRIKYDLVNKDSRSGIHSLEYDMWIRNLIAENLENSGKTLVSLMYATLSSLLSLSPPSLSLSLPPSLFTSP